MKQKLNKHSILLAFSLVTVAVLLADLAFSVTTYHDTVIAIGLIVYFIYYILTELKKNKSEVIKRVSHLFFSAKWLYIAIALYFIYDLITMLYTKDIYYSLKKLPYLIQYAAVFSILIYSMNNKKHLDGFVGIIAVTGVIVAISSYIYYFATAAPIYFMRLSTTRDYNVFACVLLFGIVFAFDYFANRVHFSISKRILLFFTAIIIIMPSFYLAGSRRMAVMLPYFLTFALIYIAVIFISNKSERKNQLVTLFFVTLIASVYLASTVMLPYFTSYAAQKEAEYKNYIEETKKDPTKKPVESKKPAYSETTIGEMFETIEDKTMLNKRKIIYTVAFEELQNFTPVELIFGRGASYDMYMYYTTDDEQLLQAYSIGENNVRQKMWLSVHNFMLSDILGGGIIKLVLGIFVVIQLFIYIFKCIRFNKRCGIILIISTAMMITTNFISGAFGMLNDIFFYIIIALIVSTLSQERKEIDYAK